LSGENELVAFTAPSKDWGEGARLCVAPEARHAACRFASAKTLSWAMNLVIHEEAHVAGYDEAVLLNERGEISECTSANLFAVFGETVLTPPLDSGCLPGVTRSLLLEDVRVPGIAVREQTLFLDDFARADQIFMTSTTRNLLPVLAVEGLAVKRDDAVRARLNQAFDEYTARYVAAHRR
jgi:branched-chain amino acid aminotransferase